MNDDIANTETVEATETAPESLLGAPAPTLGENEYFLAEGIKGAGDRPEWYNSGKYKSVADQAAAYKDLEKKFGGFTGAPKEGYAMPEGVDNDDALFTELKTFADESNMSQEYFDKAWALMTAQDQAVEQVNRDTELARLGDNAQQRIQNLEGFVRNNMSADDAERAAQLATNADMIEFGELIIKAVAPKKLPIDGGVAPSGITKADIEAASLKTDQHGNLLRSVDPSYDKKVMQMWEEFAGNEPYQRTFG